MDEELEGQLPLFEVGDAVIVRTFSGGGGEKPVSEYTIQEYVPWQELPENAED